MQDFGVDLLQYQECLNLLSPDRRLILLSSLLSPDPDIHSFKPIPTEKIFSISR